MSHHLLLPRGHTFAGLPANGFGTIVADPPYPYKGRGRKGVISDRAIENHYQVMTLDDIHCLPIVDLALPDCWFWVWVPGVHHHRMGNIMERMGIEYCGVGLTWAKLNKNVDPAGPFYPNNFFMGLGFGTRKNTDACYLGKIGHPQRRSASVRELLISPIREHSRKPDEAFAQIEQFGDGPYLDLFGRSTRPNWTTWGNQATKFDAPMMESIHV